MLSEGPEGLYKRPPYRLKGSPDGVLDIRHWVSCMSLSAATIPRWYSSHNTGPTMAVLPHAVRSV